MDDLNFEDLNFPENQGKYNFNCLTKKATVNGSLKI